MEEQIFQMLMLLHSELQFNSSLMAGLFPKPYVDEHIVPKLNEFNALCESILVPPKETDEKGNYFTS